MVKPLFRYWTQQEVQRDFNYLDGVMYWATGPRKGKVAGWLDERNYVLIRYKDKLVRSHNLVWLYHKGVWPDFELDHINNDPLDNRIENLRPADRNEQSANQKLQSRRAGKYKGVHKNDTSYYVKIKKNGKQYHVGSFKTEVEAALAYNKKAIELFGEFARLNEVER